MFGFLYPFRPTVFCLVLLSLADDSLVGSDLFVFCVRRPGMGSFFPFFLTLNGKVRGMDWGWRAWHFDLFRIHWNAIATVSVRVLRFPTCNLSHNWRLGCFGVGYRAIIGYWSLFNSSFHYAAHVILVIDDVVCSRVCTS
jgi:hypothetical protein